MTAWERAVRWHGEHHPAEDFAAAVGEYLAHGLVHVEPGCLLLARECHWDEAAQEARLEGAPNAWFVRLAVNAGRSDALREFLRVAPHRHEWLVWARRGDGRARIFQWDRVARKAGYNHG